MACIVIVKKKPVRFQTITFCLLQLFPTTAVCYFRDGGSLIARDKGENNHYVNMVAFLQ